MLSQSTSESNARVTPFTLLSPIVIISIGFMVAQLSKQSLDPAIAWLPPMITYWLSLAIAIILLRGISTYRIWLLPSKGGWGWRLLAMVSTAMIVIPTLLFAKSFSMSEGWRVGVWLLITFLNPIVEEGYWRATLMDASHKWHGLASILYSAFWFGLSHPLIIGVNIVLVAGITGFVGTFINGLIWSAVYDKTQSLRWGIASHILANLFSIGIFLGIIVF